MESPTPREHDIDFDLTVRKADHDGADTSGLDQAVAEAHGYLTEARRGSAEADEHIRDARRAVEQDAELAPDPEQDISDGGHET